MKKFINHIKTEWYRYGLETLVVVVGILVAFVLNNWNETRKKKIEEIEVLVGIRNALASDLTNQFDSRIKQNEYHIESLELVLHYMENNLPHNDSLNFHFGVLTSTGGIQWTPNLTSFKLLESKGLDLIKNDSLVKSILNVYNLNYPKITSSFDNYLRNIYEYGRPIAHRKFIWHLEINSGGGMKPVDYPSLLQDVEYRNTLLVLRSNGFQIRRNLSALRVNVENVIKQIDRELKNE